MQTEALVRRGQGKEICEDRCLLNRVILTDIDGRVDMNAPYVVAVADGVGGNGMGDIAAGFVCQRIAHNAVDDLSDADAVRQYLLERNDELIKLAQGIHGARSMATTLTGIIVNRHGGWLFNAGNGRIYTMEGGRLHQLTHDHTTYALYMNAGNIEEARRCNHSEITCCFGNGNPNQLSQLEIIPLYDFSALLMTSDGIHESLTTEQMESVLSYAQSPADACRRMCETAANLGSKDDMTVALVY